jgi:hypothetical protein
MCEGMGNAGDHEGRHGVSSPRKRLRTRRGGGWVVWGWDALCCASPSSCPCEHFPPPPRATQASPPYIHSTPAPTNATICPKKPARVNGGRDDAGWGACVAPVPAALPAQLYRQPDRPCPYGSPVTFPDIHLRNTGIDISHFQDKEHVLPGPHCSTGTAHDCPGTA